MKTLFTLDYKNYDSNWEYSKRDSARGIIVFSDKKEIPFKKEEKVLHFSKNKEFINKFVYFYYLFMSDIF